MAHTTAHPFVCGLVWLRITFVCFFFDPARATTRVGSFLLLIVESSRSTHFLSDAHLGNHFVFNVHEFDCPLRVLQTPLFKDRLCFFSVAVPTLDNGAAPVAILIAHDSPGVLFGWIVCSLHVVPPLLERRREQQKSRRRF